MMKEITLHARQRQLLSVLNAKHGTETGKELAARLGVSERTVRSDIREINGLLEDYGVQIEARYGKGYELSVQNHAFYMQLFSHRDNYITRDDRIRTLLLQLVQESDWHDLGDLEDEMYVSRTTLENDIRDIRKRISARYPYLEVQRSGNSIRLEDDERKCRALLIRYYSENWDYDSREGIVLKEDELDREILDQIKDIMEETLKRRDIRLDDLGLIYMVLAIAVMYLRVREGHLILQTESVSELPAADADRVVSDVLNILKDRWGLEIPCGEYVWLRDVFRQLLILNKREADEAEILRLTDVDSQRIANGLIERIRDIYELDFTEDSRLKTDMMLHVQAVRNGIVVPQLQNHVMGNSLRIRYPFLGDIAHDLRLQVEEQCAVDLWQDEEDYLLPFLISAQRKLYVKKRGRGIPVAVISHLNASLTQFLMEQLVKYYADVMDLMGPYPVYDRERAWERKPLIVISTVQMKNFSWQSAVPVITVSPLVEEGDREKIERCLNRMKFRFLYPEMKEPIQHYFRRDLLYRIKNKDSLAAAIGAVQDRIYEKNYMVQKIAVDLESDYYAVLKNGFVFLYQTDEHAEATTISLVGLERMISWKHARNLRTIMFIVLKPEDRRLLGWFYYLAEMLAGNPDALRNLLDTKRPEELEKGII